MIAANGIFERGGNVRLPHNSIEGLGTVFAGGDDEFFHGEVACKVTELAVCTKLAEKG